VEARWLGSLPSLDSAEWVMKRCVEGWIGAGASSERRHHDAYVCEMQPIKDPSAQFHGGRRSP